MKIRQTEAHIADMKAREAVEMRAQVEKMAQKEKENTKRNFREMGSGKPGEELGSKLMWKRG